MKRVGFRLCSAHGSGCRRLRRARCPRGSGCSCRASYRALSRLPAPPSCARRSRVPRLRAITATNCTVVRFAPAYRRRRSPHPTPGAAKRTRCFGRADRFFAMMRVARARFACAIASASFGRSLLRPLSTSTYGGASNFEPVCSTYAFTAASCASSPSPERPCLTVDTCVQALHPANCNIPLKRTIKYMLWEVVLECRQYRAKT